MGNVLVLHGNIFIALTKNNSQTNNSTRLKIYMSINNAAVSEMVVIIVDKNSDNMVIHMVYLVLDVDKNSRHIRMCKINTFLLFLSEVSTSVCIIVCVWVFLTPNY